MFVSFIQFHMDIMIVLYDRNITVYRDPNVKTYIRNNGYFETKNNDFLYLCYKK